jgi:hypothetical protein
MQTSNRDAGKPAAAYRAPLLNYSEKRRKTFQNPVAGSGRPIYRFVKPLVGSSNLPPGTAFSPDQRAARKHTEVTASGGSQAYLAQGRELPGIGPGKTRRKSHF